MRCLICGLVCTRFYKRREKYICFIQVVSFLLPFFALFLSLVPFKEADHNHSLRNKGMISLQAQPEESDIIRLFALTIIPFMSQVKFCSRPLRRQPVRDRHTWTPVPWRCSIWALIVCMLLMIFFWWPTRVIPKLITSLEERTTLWVSAPSQPQLFHYCEYTAKHSRLVYES